MAIKTYSFKLMKSRRFDRLYDRIETACDVYNHCIALHNRFYRLFGKYLQKNALQKHMARLLRRSKKKLRKLEGSNYEERPLFVRPESPGAVLDEASSTETVPAPRKKKRKTSKNKESAKKQSVEPKKKKARRRRGRLERLRSIVKWGIVGSQARQNIVDRIHNGYVAFFDNIKERKAGLTKRRVSKPTFKSRRKYKSFTLKVNTKKIKDADGTSTGSERESVGWELLPGNGLLIGIDKYRFRKSREIHGEARTLTVKRDISRGPAKQSEPCPSLREIYTSTSYAT